MENEEKNVVPTVETPPSARSRMMDRLKKRHPDTEYAEDDEEALYSAMNADMDEDEKELNGLREREGKLVEMFEADPRTATFLAAWSKGENPYVAMARVFGSDMFDKADDPEFIQQMAEANEEYLNTLSHGKELNAMHEKNFSETMDLLDALEEEGVPAEDLSYAMQTLAQIVDDGIVGKYNRDNIMMVIAAKNKDKELEEARYEAEVKGRNAKIKEMKRSANKGDGVTMLGGGTQNNGASNRERGIFGLASEAR